jgi:hypothetical protein
LRRRYSERLTGGNVYADGGQKGRYPVPRVSDDPNREFLANQGEDSIGANIAELFASPAPELDELFADPMVRTRIGVLIAQAITEPTSPQRRLKSR